MSLILDKEERARLTKLGYTVDELGRIVKEKESAKIRKSASTEDLIYCGFNTYLSRDGHLFEKVGNELVEIDTDESDAERRFVDRHMRK